MWILLAALAGALISGGVGLYTNYKNQQFTEETNDTNYERTVDMWNKTNSYNSPKNEMQRYIDAGLNPNLIYNKSTTTQMANVGNAQAPQNQNPYTSDMDIFMKYIQMKTLKEDIKSKELDNQLKKQTLNDKIQESKYNADALKTKMENFSQRLQVEDAIRKIELYKGENSKDISIKVLKQQSEKLGREIQQYDDRSAWENAKYKYEIGQYNSGLNPNHSNAWLQLLNGVISKYDINWMDKLMKNIPSIKKN